MLSLANFVTAGAVRLSSGPHPERMRRDAESLLLHVLGKNRAWLLAHTDETLSDDQTAHYTKLIERRFSGEPMQYIIGEAEFYGLPFRVTPDVLIPRPETEHLVEKALALAGAPSFPRTLLKGSETSIPNPCRILDIGTGSGAIAVALAHKLPHATITATDFAASALVIAQENASRNGATIRFLQGDLLAPVAGETFDLIVSNPPYVSTTDRTTLSVEVRDHEPALALFAGNDGLEVYRRLIPTALSALACGGFLVLEIGHGQSDSIRSLLAAAGFLSVEFTSDLQGIPRVASALRP